VLFLIGALSRVASLGQQMDLANGVSNAVKNKIAVAIFAAASAFPSKQLSSIRLTKEKLGFEIEA
jgi:hypothetical protein